MTNPNAQLIDNLKIHLSQTLPSHNVKEVYDYAIFPPGKLFRPMIAVELTRDLTKRVDLKANSPLSYFCSALEIHHVYTLLHDDLPCMDDDQMRRGRECTHLKFGEWQALLAGDGLLNISYDFFFRAFMNSPSMLRFITWSLGPKGLIHGQVMDLNGEIKVSFPNLIRTHQLKTARLIQLALLGGLQISGVKDFKTYKEFFRFGDAIGVSFQLIDDLIELTELNLPAHELDINPWPRCFEKCLSTLSNYTQIVNRFYQDHGLTHLQIFLGHYFEKMGEKIEIGLPNIVTYFNHQSSVENEIKMIAQNLKSLSKN